MERYLREDEPLVSVVIPTYYRNDLLEQTLQSVYNQEYDNIEIVVVDDSGESYAEPVAERHSDIIYIPKDENEGPQVARTEGIEQSSGEYIQLLDDDDRLASSKFRKQVGLLEEHGDVGVVYCGFSWENGAVVLPREDIRGDVLQQALMIDTIPCITSTMLYERAVLTRILPLSDLPGWDDLSIKVALAKLTKFDYVDEALVERTDSPNSRESSWDKLDGMKEILVEDEELYGEFPAYVRRAALAETHRIEGLQILGEKKWSFSAIVSLGKACYYAPGVSPFYIANLVASLFGRPGRDMSTRVFQLIRSHVRIGRFGR